MTSYLWASNYNRLVSVMYNSPFPGKSFYISFTVSLMWAWIALIWFYKQNAPAAVLPHLLYAVSYSGVISG